MNIEKILISLEFDLFQTSPRFIFMLAATSETT